MKNKVKLPESTNFERYNESIADMKSVGSRSQRSINTSGIALVNSLVRQASSPSKTMLPQPPRESQSLASEPVRNEEWESRVKIAEGIQALRDNSAEFMETLRRSHPITEEICNKIFSNCVALYSQYKPTFEPIINSTDQKYQAERRAINIERDFVNHSSYQFRSFRKGDLSSDAFLDEIEKIYLQCNIARRTGFNAAEILSQASKTPQSAVSAPFQEAIDKHASDEKKSVVGASSIQHSKEERGQEPIASKRSSKRPSLQPQNIDTSFHSIRAESFNQRKLSTASLNEALDQRAKVDDQLSPFSHHNTSQLGGANTQFFPAEVSQSHIAVEPSPTNIDYFDFSKGTGKQATVVEEKDPFAMFEFTKPQEQASFHQDFFGAESHFNEQPKDSNASHSEIQPPQEFPVVHATEIPEQVTQSRYFSHVSQDSVNKSMREQSFRDAKQRSQNESQLYASHLSNRLLGNVPSTAMPVKKTEVIRSTSGRRLNSNVMVAPKRVSFGNSQDANISHVNDSMSQIWEPKKPEPPQTFEQRPAPQQATPIRLPVIPQPPPMPYQSSNRAVGASVLPPVTSFGDKTDSLLATLYRDQIYPTQAAALLARIQTLQQTVADKDALEARQRRTFEEERLKWETGIRQLEREVRELRARERARDAIEKDREQDTKNKRAEIRSLLEELESKNREILNLQRQVSSIEVEAREKIIEHAGLAEQIKEQYQRIVHERDELVALNAKNSVQANLYIKEESRNRELLEKTEETSRELIKLRAELYTATAKSLSQEQTLMEQAAMIENYQQEVQKAKDNFVTALKQVSASHEKDRLALVESHQHEINRLLSRIRDIDLQSTIRQPSTLIQTPVPAVTDLRSHPSEAELRSLREENLRISIDVRSLQAEKSSLDRRVTELEEQKETLRREMAEVKEQYFEKVRDCLSKEKLLGDMSHKYSEMMGKYTAMHRDVEAHQREEARLRKELNEYHSRLMRLGNENASNLESILNDSKHTSEVAETKAKIEQLQQFVDSGLQERVDLKRQLLESQANVEVLRSRLLEEHKQQQELVQSKAAIEDERFALKQRINKMEVEKLNAELKDSMIAKIEKERMLLAAKLAKEEEKTASLEKDIQKLRVVETIAKEFESIDSGFIQEELGKFVEYLKDKLSFSKETTQKGSQDQKISIETDKKLESEPKKNPTFISWEEFNQNYNKVLTTGALYKSEVRVAAEDKQDKTGLEGLNPRNTASNGSFTFAEHTSNVSFKPNTSFLDDPDALNLHSKKSSLAVTHSVPNYGKSNQYELVVPPANFFFASHVSEVDAVRISPEVAGGLNDGKQSGLQDLVDIPQDLNAPSLAGILDKQEMKPAIAAEAFIKSFNGTTDPEKGAEVNQPIDEKAREVKENIAQVIPHRNQQPFETPGESIIGNLVSDSKPNIVETFLSTHPKPEEKSHHLTESLYSSPENAIRPSFTKFDLSRAAVDQLEWTLEDLKMFDGLADIKDEGISEATNNNADFFFGQKVSPASKDSHSSPEVQKKLFEPCLAIKFDDDLVENYEFEDNPDAKAKTLLKKSFEGIENVIKETPELTQFKDYCAMLEALLSDSPDKASFKESCLMRSGVFFHVKDWNLILKNGSLAIDKESNKIDLEMVLLTQNPIVVVKAQLVNYSRKP